MDDAVFDFCELGRTAEEISVFAAAVPHEQVRQLIAGLGEEQIDPREIGVAPLSYTALFEEDDLSRSLAVIDIGHLRTNVAVVGDEVGTARTFLRGGRDSFAKIRHA